MIDRRQLLQQSTLNGIDYVEPVPPAGNGPATEVRVTFVNPLSVAPTPGLFRVAGGDRIPTLRVLAVEPTDDPRSVLVRLAGGSDRSTYTLGLVTSALDDAPPPWVDPVLASVPVRLHLSCLTGCEEEPGCAPAVAPEPRLDYLARDWESLRAVLLDRLSVLQPDWTVRNPADVRMAMVELLAELGDRAAYQQDVVATEAYLGTARQRISVRRHVRLVGYHMSDGTNARTWVRLVVPEDVAPIRGGAIDVLPVGTRFLTGAADAPVSVVPGGTADWEARRAGAQEFRAMSGLAVVAGAHTAMRFHTWSGSRPCLGVGCTNATLVGHLPDLGPGQVVVIAEHRDPDGPRRTTQDADPTRRQAVRLTQVVTSRGGAPLTDPLTGEPITEITWQSGDALAFPLVVAGERLTDTGGFEVYADGALAHGNVVLADHGAEHRTVLGPVPDQGPVRFSLPAGPLAQVARRVSRTPTGRRIEQPFDPAGSAADALTGEQGLALPDVTVVDVEDDLPWTVTRDLLSSGTERHVVVEVDDADIGRLRFGRGDDGLPPGGRQPEPGHHLDVTYRTGNGVVGNVGAGAIRTILDDRRVSAGLQAELERCRVENPLPAVGGTEPETVEEVRQRAPSAFRVQERAVTAADYADRAATVRRDGRPAVQRATAAIRWTGSWYTVVVAVDPAGGAATDDALLTAVAEHLDLYRMAGHEVRVVPAQYAALEVGLAVHVEPTHRRDLVRAAVLALMSARRMPDGRLGLFHPDRLTFGTSVYLGPLLAGVQEIPGVDRVEATRFSRYRQPGTDARAAGRIEIGPYEIARLDDDPNHPERGRFVLDQLVGGR